MSATPTASGASAAAAKAGGHDVPPKKRRLLKAGLAGTVAILLVGGVAWYLLVPEAVTPLDRLHEALQLLDAGELDAANEIAKELEADKFHDEEFPGGVEYVLGMVKHHSIADADPAAVTSLKAAAITYLKEAEHQGLADDRRLSWAFVLGTSLESIGQPTAAQPLLEEVAAVEGPNRPTVVRLLIDLYLDPSWANPQRLARALELSELQRKTAEPKTLAAEDAVLQHAAIRLALGQLGEAETAITEAGLDAQSPAVLLMRGRMLLVAERWLEVIALLEKIPVNEEAVGNAYRPALYLMGLAAERQSAKLAQATGEGMQRTHNVADRDEYRQRAVEYYRKVTHQFPDTDEALAAEIAFGRLEQSIGAHEKALQLYGSALRTANRTDDFRNRWTSLDNFRERIREAWAEWLEDERFAEAIALADLMTPVFPRDQAYELSAMAYRGWADKSDKEFATASATERARRTESLRQLFGDTGAAYDRLAQAHRSAEHAREALWLSAEFYRRGHSFETALVTLERFLQESSTAMRPVALVRKGQILLDLDRIADAETSFQEVLKEYPTSAAVYQAQHLLGVCRLEQDDPQGAADQWDALLKMDRLAPTAVEWRDTLFALARLHTESAAWSRRQLERPEVSATETERLWADVSQKASDATQMFYEYVSRYPQSKGVAEARYHLAKSLQLLGDCRHRQWQLAETGNARDQARRELNDVLEQSLTQWQTLRDDLTAEFQADQLDPIRRQIWENVWFELPHTLFALRRYEDAIGAYSSAMHRFPQDVRVLTAHVQMAYAYAQLNRLIEARSLLEQAKVILVQNQIPATAFKAPTTNLTPTEWEQWLDRVRQVYR